MELHEVLTGIFAREIKSVILREEEDKDYLPQEAFASCQARARAMVRDACGPVSKALGLAIAKHREEKHDENHAIEVAALSAVVPEADAESMTGKSWWNW